MLHVKQKRTLKMIEGNPLMLLREMAEIEGVSKQAIHKRLKKLADKGLLENYPNKGYLITKKGVDSLK